jgi:integrase
VGPLLPRTTESVANLCQMTSDGPESRWCRLVILCNRGARPCKTLKIRSLRLRAVNPWNKGKLIGAKPPLRPKHVWSIRTKLQIAGRTRDLAMFNLAIDSKLRGCDVVSLRVEDVAPHGHAVDRATVRQKKTGQPVRFEMTEQTREAVDSYIGATRKQPGEFLFSGRRGRDRPITTRQYARLVCQWIASIGLDSSFFGTHSLRRTKATLIYRRTGNLGQSSFYWDTRKLKVRCATWGLRSTTLSP